MVLTGISVQFCLNIYKLWNYKPAFLYSVLKQILLFVSFWISVFWGILDQWSKKEEQWFVVRQSQVRLFIFKLILSLEVPYFYSHLFTPPFTCGCNTMSDVKLQFSCHQILEELIKSKNENLIISTYLLDNIIDWWCKAGIFNHLFCF